MSGRGVSSPPARFIILRHSVDRGLVAVVLGLEGAVGADAQV
jgi:hypothetical protein